MAWTVDYTEAAQSQLRRLDPRTTRRIVAFMNERIAPSDNPRQHGHALHGRLRGYWRYRVGNYRVICDIQDEVLRVLVVRVGRRDQVYC